jgi:hypothetical protein
MKLFIEGLDTPGGHILTCLLLIFVGAGLLKIGVSRGEELIVGAGAVLFAAMRGNGSDSKP